MGARLAAQVLLADAGQRDPQRVVTAFHALGFQTGVVVGCSFAIEAERQVFREVFGVVIRIGADGALSIRSSREGSRQGDPASPQHPEAGSSGGAAGPGGARGAAAASSDQLPLQALPPSLRPLVTTVLFTRPPDFGPGGGFMA